MKHLPLLEFHYHGSSAQEYEQAIRAVLDETYPNLGQWLPPKVEVHLFSNAGELTAFIQNEKTQLGITTLGDESFICSHDAWHGFPRLLICTARLSALPPLARLGALRHEAGHTVLHGGLAYYVFRVPQDCLRMAQAFGLDNAGLQQVLYFCAIAVKDFEVTRLLLNAGFRDCQVAFAGIQSSKNMDDELAWLLAKSHPLARRLFFASQLKTLLLGWPLAEARLIALKEMTDSMLSYMQPEERKLLIETAEGIVNQLGQKTHDNVSLTLRLVLQNPL
jgi:hypothetical protein